MYLRWRMRDTFVAGPWTLGAHYRWTCPVAIAEVVIICVYMSAPMRNWGATRRPREATGG